MKTSRKIIKAAIIDDEQNARDIISKIIISNFDNIIINTAKNVETGINLIKGENPDIVFLDIDMPDGTGFDLLKKIESPDFKLIFITAYQEHAIKAIYVYTVRMIITIRSKPYYVSQMKQFYVLLLC